MQYCAAQDVGVDGVLEKDKCIKPLSTTVESWNAFIRRQPYSLFGLLSSPSNIQWVLKVVWSYSGLIVDLLLLRGFPNLSTNELDVSDWSTFRKGYNILDPTIYQAELKSLPCSSSGLSSRESIYV